MKVDPHNHEPQPANAQDDTKDAGHAHAGCSCDGGGSCSACHATARIPLDVNHAADIGKTPEGVQGKRYIQQAELERDIAAWAETLPLFKEGDPSKEGMPADQRKPVGEPKARTTIYGIPKNGTIVAELVAAHLRSKGHDVVTTFNADHANFIVDDLLDSGRTAMKYLKRWDCPVYCLYSKKKELKAGFEVDRIHAFKQVGTAWLVFPWEADPLSEQSETDAVTRLIEMIGEDVNRDGLKETPERFVKAFKEMTRGYDMEVKLTQFDKDGFDQLVSLTDIPFFSLCEHHLLPFYGKAHIAYVPNDKIVGISKLARITDKYACRLQNQERIGEQIVKELTEALNPAGVAVVIEATHLCCAARGVGKPNMTMRSSKLTGVFREHNNAARLEFFHLISK